MQINKIVEGAIGLYLILPGIEDAATGGVTLAPSVLLGSYLLADAFGIRFS